MSTPQKPTYCPHKMNPVTCWHCIQANRATATQKARDAANAGQSTGDPLLDMIARSASAFGPPAPTRTVPPPRGDQAVKPVDKPKPARAIPVEAQAQMATVQNRAAETLGVWTKDENGIDQPPPKRAEIIGRLSSHPDAPQK